MKIIAVLTLGLILALISAALVKWEPGTTDKNERQREQHKGLHWRVRRSGSFSFNVDRLPYYLEYKGFAGIWHGLNNPYHIGWIAFQTNEEAIEYANRMEPLSVEPCDLPVVMKPWDWNARQLASGNYGREKQAQALIWLAQNAGKDERS